MKYQCDYCLYLTTNSGNWSHHIHSKKHIKKCADCDNQSNIEYDHSKKVRIIRKNIEINENKSHTDDTESDVSSSDKNTTINDNMSNIILNTTENNNNEIELYKHLLHKTEKQLEDKENQIVFMQKVIDNVQKTLDNVQNTSGEVAKTSTSTLNYVITNFKQAPQLKQIEKDGAEEILKIELEKSQKTKRLQKTKSSNKENEISHEDTYVEKILKLYKNKKLVSYIKNIIVSVYKTSNPCKQSLWNTDASRLNYLIRDIVGKKIEWITDKKGLKLKEYVVDPITNLILEIIEKYRDKKFKITQDINKSLDEVNNASQIHQLSAKLITDIKDENIQKSICNELCSEFYLDKNYVNNIINNINEESEESKESNTSNEDKTIKKLTKNQQKK